MRWGTPIRTYSQSLYFQPNGQSLHCMDELQTMIFNGLSRGYKTSELCKYLHNSSDERCHAYIEKLRKHWGDSGLLVGDRPESSNEFTYKVYTSIGRGVVSIQTESHALFESLNHVLVCFDKLESQPDHIIEVGNNKNNSKIDITVDGHLKHSCKNMDQLLVACLYEIGELATHEFPRLFIAHAAAVRNENQVLLIPGYAGQGKSTLVSGLIKRGYQLINDDIVPVNFDGTLVAINAPLKIKSGSWHVLAPLYPEILTSSPVYRADDQVMKLIPTAGLCCKAGSSHTATAIVLPQYSPSCSSPSLTKLGAGEGLQSLMLAEPHLPHRLTKPYLQAIVDWQAKLPVWRVNYKHTDEAANLLAGLPKDIEDIS